MAVLVTGAAGFIGYHLTKALLARGDEVIGVDNMNSYYGLCLKAARLDQLNGLSGFTFVQGDIAEGVLQNLPVQPDRIVHLAAQAGVRYSIDNPAAYVHSNLVGHANILELARQIDCQKTLYASSSSIYGGNTKIPFDETDKTDDPVSLYGATKKSNELLSHSYSRLYRLPLTGLRFFTVYGPWGRPDMAYWLFTDKVLKGEPIRVFNQGKMGRDFTYIDDCVGGIIAALDSAPVPDGHGVPHRIYNLGNDSPEELMDMISLIEKHAGTEATKNFEPMQPGDVERTWANIDRARSELNYAPTTSLDEGLGQFVDWFKNWAEV